MALSLADHRRNRSAARRNLVRVISALDDTAKEDFESMDLDALKRQADTLETADEAFSSSHDEMFELDEAMDETSYEAESRTHQAMVSKARVAIRRLREKRAAWALMSELEEAMCILELKTDEDPRPSVMGSLEGVRRLSDNFVKTSTDPFFSKDELFKEFRRSINERMNVVDRRWKLPNPLPAAPEEDKVKPAGPVSQGLKVELPTFDGAMINWRDFWGLFSAVMNKNTQLEDHERRVLLVKSMGTPEAVAQAKAAVAYTSSYKDATKRLRQHYERNRTLHRYHLKEVSQTDLIRNERPDLERLLDRLEKHSRGIKQACAYTADQMLTVFGERVMSPVLLNEWMKSSDEYDDAPPPFM